MTKPKEEKMKKIYLTIGVWCMCKVYKYYGVVASSRSLKESNIAIFYNNQKVWKNVRKLL